MKTQVIIEIFGYIGSALVVVSMLMSSIVKLRVINTVGSVISSIYAVICGAIPLAVMNICLIAINGVNLVKLLRSQHVYDLVSGRADEAATGYFLDRYEADIKRYFPDFDRETASNKAAYSVFCDGEQAGIMLAEKNDGELSVMIDYSTPKYRDCSVGKTLYERLAAGDIRALRFTADPSEEHISYMTKMGFIKENGIYTKRLSEAK